MSGNDWDKVRDLARQIWCIASEEQSEGSRIIADRSARLMALADHNGSDFNADDWVKLVTNNYSVKT